MLMAPMQADQVQVKFLVQVGDLDQYSDGCQTLNMTLNLTLNLILNLLLNPTQILLKKHCYVSKYSVHYPVFDSVIIQCLTAVIKSF